MSEYASKGLAGTALGTGIGGLALGLMNNGGLGGLLGGWNGNGWNGNGYGGCGNGCGDSAFVNRYEAGQSARISELETEVKLRDANFYALSEVGKLRDYMEHRFDRVEHEICDQKVMNATITSNMTCMANQIAALNGLTKLVVPNASICPGWGDVTVSVTPAPTAGT